MHFEFYFCNSFVFNWMSCALFDVLFVVFSILFMLLWHTNLFLLLRFSFSLLYWKSCSYDISLDSINESRSPQILNNYRMQKADLIDVHLSNRKKIEENNVPSKLRSSCCVSCFLHFFIQIASKSEDVNDDSIALQLSNFKVFFVQ